MEIRGVEVEGRGWGGGDGGVGWGGASERYHTPDKDVVGGYVID